jgi:uncharacterized protein (DUF4415 family)
LHERDGFGRQFVASAVCNRPLTRLKLPKIDAGQLPWEEASETMIERSDLEQVSIRLPKNDVAALRRSAANLGVGYTTLIRMILRRYLKDQPSRP